MQTYHYQDDFNNYIHFYGRHQKTSSGHAFYYTASGFCLKAKGSYIKLVFHSYAEEPNKKAYIVLKVNGEQQVFMLQQGLTEVEYILDQAPCEIYVYKRSESMMSRTELVSVTIDGKLLPITIRQKPINILFIGDSLTCGYGNLSDDPNLPFSTAYEDGLQSYASLAAEGLDANYHIVAVSGIGLYKSIYANVTMPSIYEQYDIYDTTPYPFQEHFDIVVINLGTNDYAYMKFLVEPTRIYEEQKFIEAYQTFVERLKILHPKAKFIIVSQGSRQGFMDEVICRAYEQVKDKHTYHFRASDVPKEDGIGQQYHPTIKTHQRWGKELKAFIENIRK